MKLITHTKKKQSKANSTNRAVAAAAAIEQYAFVFCLMFDGCVCCHKQDLDEKALPRPALEARYAAGGSVRQVTRLLQIFAVGRYVNATYCAVCAYT
jgi:hypothetical protein